LNNKSCNKVNFHRVMFFTKVKKIQNSIDTASYLSTITWIEQKSIEMDSPGFFYF